MPTSSKTRGLWPIPASFVVIASALLAWGLADGIEARSEAEPSSIQCPDAQLPDGAQPATFELDADAVPTVALGRDRLQRHRELFFRVSDPSRVIRNQPCVAVELTRFLSTDGADELDADDIAITSAKWVGGRYKVTLAFDRTNGGLGDAGTFTGQVMIVDPRSEPLQTPISVTLAEPRWQFVWSLLFFMMALCTFYVAFDLLPAETSAAGPVTGTGTPRPRTQVFAITAGVIAACLALVNGYYASTTWELSVNSVITLATSLGGAFLVTAGFPTAANALRRTDGP